MDTLLTTEWLSKNLDAPDLVLLDCTVTTIPHEDGGHNVSARPGDGLAAMNDLDGNARIITYCGGGIAASANAFIMARLGFTNVAVFTASLQEWAADAACPMVVDAP